MAVGVDFGTESARAVVVETGSGRELAQAACPYPHGVIEGHLPLPDEDVALPPDWALQDPRDYVQVLGSTVRTALEKSGVDAEAVIGLGIDFTACTMLPTTADGTPLCALPELRREPHAWVKLWKHHAAQRDADHINAVARQRGENWLGRYGGKVSSEWFFSKSLQILREAPHVYRAAKRLIEAGDWVVWQLTGIETRNACTAGYKAMWSKRDGFPSREFFSNLSPGLADVVDEKMRRGISSLGAPAGELTGRAAQLTGLPPGIPVAVANIDAHVSVPAVKVTSPGSLVAIMGTSTCLMALGRGEASVEGICGVVEDGIVPGYFGYEAGQAAVGDVFGWWVDRVRPMGRGGTPATHRELEEEARALRVGASGLVALDWWNGNRSILVDAQLSGLLVGLTLSSTPAEIYRALLESTAFGTRVIIDALDARGIPVQELVVCGGLPGRSKLLMQITADVTRRPVKVARTTQAPALGSAMFGAVAAGPAAGGYASIVEASDCMARLGDVTYAPRETDARIYDELFEQYRELHDLFGRDRPLMQRLHAIRSGQATRPKGETRWLDA